MDKEIKKDIPTPPLKQENKNNANKFMIIIIILLLGFCGFLIWQNLELKKNVSEGITTITNVSSERDKVKSELEDMLAKYNDLQTNNKTLSADLEAQKAKIEELIKKAQGKDWSIYKLKKEAASLRTIMKGYIVQIDSLNQLNGKLKEENSTVKTELHSEQNKTKDLTEQNDNLKDIVTVASQLKTSNLTSMGIRVKSNNTGKPTDRAKKVDKIRTSFTILKNKITKAGNKFIYVRILTPDGKVLSEKTDDSNKFDFNGVRGIYSIREQINYQNEDMQITMDWKKIDDFPIGEYNIEVYSDGVDIGKTKFSLK